MMTPHHISAARDFLASARIAGDAEMIEVATRIWYATCFPNAHPAIEADLAIYREWRKTTNGKRSRTQGNRTQP